MKKLFILVILVLVACVACSIIDDSTSSTPTQNTEEPANTDHGSADADTSTDSVVMQKLGQLGFKEVDEAILAEYVPDYCDTINVEKEGTQVFKLTTLSSAYFVIVDTSGAIVNISSTESNYKLRTTYYPYTPPTYDVVDLAMVEETWFFDCAGSYSENFARRIQCEARISSFMSLFAVNDAAVVSDMTVLYFPTGDIYESARLIQTFDTIKIQGQIINYDNVGIIIKVESFTITNE